MSEHAWGCISFNYASWTECDCGYRPESQEDMDNHIPPQKEES